MFTFFLLVFCSHLHIYVKADTTDTECKKSSGGNYGEFLDLLEAPEFRQRAQSIASVITSTIDGRNPVCYAQNLFQGLKYFGC